MKYLCEEEENSPKKSLTFALQTNRERRRIMARAIRETPVLRGKNARRFEKAMREVKPYSKEKRDALRKEYEEFRSKLTIRV